MKNKVEVIWKPHEGSQELFLGCPVWECLLHGNRGGGKTDVLLMDYLSGVGQGYGIDYKGLLLREATTELGDLITKCKKWIPRIFPTAKYNGSKKIWTFEDGETLWLNYARVEDDYWQYHGHEYPWIGWEELTNWPFPTVYLKIMSCNRSSNPDIPKKYRATCNPSGPGHQWVKQRFINKIQQCQVVYDEFHQGRTHIKSKLDENETLLNADPLYGEKIKSLTQDDKMLRDAWVNGSWDLITGGFFTDVWVHDIHVLPEFYPPESWKIVRSFDWGSSKPWGVTYGLITNGEQPENFPFTIPAGSVIIVDEIYGWTGVPNEGDQALSSEIAERTLFHDKTLRDELDVRVFAGPADTSIYDVKDGQSIGKSLVSYGLHWKRAYKGSGSRIAGWAIIRQMLGAAKRQDPDKPHLYFWNKAENHIRTLPIMQRDKRKPEDIDTDLEDHLMDSLRYLLNRKASKMRRRKVRT